MSPAKKATIERFGKAIAHLLSEHRGSIGMTQNQLAALTGVSQSQLSKQLRGTRAINMDELDTICKALRLEMPALIESAEDLIRQDVKVAKTSGRHHSKSAALKITDSSLDEDTLRE